MDLAAAGPDDTGAKSPRVNLASANADQRYFSGRHRRCVEPPSCLRRAIPIRPSTPEAHSQTAAGMGITASRAVPYDHATLEIVEASVATAIATVKVVLKVPSMNVLKI